VELCLIRSQHNMCSRRPSYRLVRFFFALVLLAALISAAAAQKPSPRPAPRPNLLLITIDTLRPDHLHCYGHEIQTPSIDSLAADGIRFDQAYTPIPITLPSHSVILSGTYPMMSGMHDFSGNNLSADQATLATVLRGRGYDTGAVVAAAVLDRRFGLNHGFDFYYDHFNFSRLSESNLDFMERPANDVIDQALKWLAKPRKGPFFLWVHLYDPHHPYHPPPPFNQTYKSNLYDGEIAFADSQLARLLGYLKQHGAYDRTVITLSGDHGEGLGEHGEKTHGFFIYNSTTHVPLIIKPSINSKFTNRVVKKDVSLVDLMPTLLGILSTPVPSKVQGKNLAGMVLRGTEIEPSPLYFETYLPRIHFNWSELRGLSTGNYHFIDAPKPELFDRSKDPGETRNLFADKGAVASEMRSQLTTTIQRFTTEHEMAARSTLDPQLAERLRSLGYTAFTSGEEDSPVSDRKLPDPKDRVQVYETVTEAIDDSQHGRYSESIEKLKSTLTTEQNSVPIHYLLGLNYYRTKEFASAVAEFKKALELSPNYMLAVFNLGLASAALGDDNEAIKYLKRTLELDPTNFGAAYDLGATYLHRNMPEESIAAFRQSVMINPDFAPGYRALGEMLVYQGKLDEGLKELRTAVQLAPNDPRIHQALARALEAKGLHMQASEEMRKAQEEAR
jgi:arylsulfatase A-like enzyme/cytochrome c-type biogenesis protein CcmH/NrfG